MIVTSQLTKIFDRETYALKNIDLTINQGLFGLLGPNGAGKTTFMRLVVGLLNPTQGSISVFGLNPAVQTDKLKIRAMLGYLPQELGLYQNLSPDEFLTYIAHLKGITEPNIVKKEISRVLNLVNLEDKKNIRIHKFSGGMKRRVGIAQALLGNPKLLIVDEPTAGLDPEERVNFRNLLADIAAETIVIFSTHTVEDVNISCNDLAIIRKGEIAFQGAPQTLLSKIEGYVWSVVGQDQPSSPGLIVTAKTYQQNGMTYRVLGTPPPEMNPVPVDPSLEDAYIWLLNQNK